MKGVDAVGKRVLGALIQDPRASAEDIAARIGATPQAVQARLARLEEQGVLRGFSVRLSPEKLGCPHEILVTGAPTADTTRDALKELCDARGVTRVFTLAHQNAIAFTYRGQKVDEMRVHAAGLARRAGLREPDVTLIVDTLFDDSSHGLQQDWEPVAA